MRHSRLLTAMRLTGYPGEQSPDFGSPPPTPFGSDAPPENFRDAYMGATAASKMIPGPRRYTTGPPPAAFQVLGAATQ
jgi:hypothetical protein